jgi:hypothetical protein
VKYGRVQLQTIFLAVESGLSVSDIFVKLDGDVQAIASHTRIELLWRLS